jgi:hypothetical protein
MILQHTSRRNANSVSNGTDMFANTEGDGGAQHNMFSGSFATPVITGANSYLFHDEALSGPQLEDFLAETGQTLSGLLAPGISETEQLRAITDDSAPPGTQLCFNAETCIVRATNILKTLHVCAGACLSSRAEASSSSNNSYACPRTTDTVLTGNGEATRAIADILKCSCSLKPQLQLLAAAALEKLVNWYRAVLRSIYCHDSASPESPGQEDQGRGERVLHQRISIGDHWLDNRLQVPIMTHVVLGRLQELESLVEVLSSRIKESNPARNSNKFTAVSLGEVGLLEIIRDRLINYLKSQLHAIREELVCLRESSMM